VKGIKSIALIANHAVLNGFLQLALDRALVPLKERSRRCIQSKHRCALSAFLSGKPSVAPSAVFARAALSARVMPTFLSPFVGTELRGILQATALPAFAEFGNRIVLPHTNRYIVSLKI
jgi:hypothetical protein